MSKKTIYVDGYDKLNAIGIKVTQNTQDSEMMKEPRVYAAVKRSLARLAEVDYKHIIMGEDMTGTEIPASVADMIMEKLV